MNYRLEDSPSCMTTLTFSSPTSFNISSIFLVSILIPNTSRVSNESLREHLDMALMMIWSLFGSDFQLLEDL